MKDVSLGDYALQLVKNAGIVSAIVPAVYGWGEESSGAPICLKDWDHCTVIIETGAGEYGAVPNPEEVTLTQDVSVTPTAAVKALPFTRYSTNEANVASSVLVDTACVNMFELLAANAIYAIEVDADSLDVDKRFDCMRIVIRDTQKFDLYCAKYILTKGRFIGPVGDMHNARID